jgi:hypothetical protein
VLGSLVLSWELENSKAQAAEPGSVCCGFVVACQRRIGSLLALCGVLLTKLDVAAGCRNLISVSRPIKASNHFHPA